MQSRIFVGWCASIGMLASMAAADTVEVSVGSYFYEPQFPAVQPGDVIRWVWDAGNHDVTSGAGCSEETDLFYAPLTSTNTSYEWTVPQDQDGAVVPYYCSVGNHCVAGNQFGALLVNVGAVHFVSTNGFNFEPAEITVAPGDVVIWIHDGGSHTVTSGAGCVADGRFDSILDNFNPMPFYRVPTDEASGSIPYYCTPHCGMAMTGVINVDGGVDCPADLNGDGAVDVNDILEAVGGFGTTYSVDDILIVLDAFGQPC